MEFCRTQNCTQKRTPESEFCDQCIQKFSLKIPARTPSQEQTLASKYPQYYKSVADVDEIDVYAVHQLFDIQDPSGAIQHASKKLLLSGVRTGGKSKFKDIKEARDTLNRWLQLNPEA